MSKQPKNPPTAPTDDPFQSIDPTALQTVSGGASSGSNSEVTTALNSILDSIKDLAAQRQGSSFGTNEMMLMMMMMGQQRQAPRVVSSSNPYAGYTIDGVFYPFPR